MVDKMADLLIKGMEMPKDCPMCPLAHWNKMDRLTGCELGPRYVPENDVNYWQSDTRPSWCPLVEVPAHGELVDRDKLLAEMADEIIRRGGDEQSIGIAWAQSAVEFATTVLEASE